MIFFLAIVLFGAALIAIGSPNIQTQRVALLVFGAALLIAVLAPEPGHATTSRTCATINNVTNVAAWSGASTGRAAYTDAGDALKYSRPVPRAVLLAEAKLTTGKPGPKIARACA